MEVGRISSVDYYHRRRKALLREILGIPEEQEIYCQDDGCDASGYEDHEWHVDHIDEEKNGTKDGGWQHLYQLEEEVEEGDTALEVVCRTSHEERDGKIFEVQEAEVI